MPMDSEGQYRHNHESASMHSKAAGKKYEPAGKPDSEEGMGDKAEIHSHGDGTFHTVHGGEKMEHPTHGHALIHLAKVHAEPGHSHFVAHHDGEQHHSHSLHEGGEPESRDHEDEAGVESHLQEHLGGGEADHDRNPEQEDQQPAGAGALGGMY